MCVSQNKNRLFLAVVLGVLMTSGCSGHSVKYGASSEGDGMSSTEEDMNGGTGEVPYGTVYRSDGTPVHGGTVDGNSGYLSGDEGAMNSESLVRSDGASEAGSGADYGHQYKGVDGSGPNYGSVSGFGQGSADATNPDPEAWANAYLRGGQSSQEFYGDPSGQGPSNGSGETANYGHDYNGVSGSSPQYGAVDGFSQGSASSMESNPETWAQAYLQENGGASPEYVDPGRAIAQTNSQHSSSMKNGVSNGGGIGTSNNGGQTLRHMTSTSEGRVHDIYFAFDSWSISSEAAQYLEEGAQWLHANPTKALTIEGHCDQRGTQDYNLVLGKKRAEAARDYLVNLGVQANRIKIVSYGKERPACQKSNEDCFQENRRNHMVVRVNQS